MNRAPLLSLALLGLLGTASATPQGFVGPFQAGLRWIHAPSLGSPWVPGPVCFAGGSDLVWVGTQAANRKLLLLAGPEAGVTQPVFEDPAAGSASHITAVGAGSGGDRLFSLSQYPEPDLFSRRSVVARHSALHPGTASTFSPEWSHAFPFVSNGPALMAVDESGGSVAAAAYDSVVGSVHLRRLDGVSGALVHTQVLQGARGLDALAISGDGTRIAVSLGSRLVTLGAGGVALHDAVLPAPIHALALDREGARLVVGTRGELRVYDFDGAQYQVSHSVARGQDRVASKVDLSPDGETYAVAWYRFLAIDELRYEVYGGASHSLLNELVQSGSASSLQNAPVGIEINADGSRILFAAWGRGDSAPEVVLLERGQSQPLMEVDLPGSAMGITLDARGRRFTVVTKNLHANQAGSTGEVRLYDTGEADLEQTAPARLGSTLELESSHPGASFALFLIGVRANAPSYPAGTSGALWLLRNGRLQVHARPADAAGRSTLSLPISSHLGMLGAERSVQVGHRVGGQIVLSDSLLDPLFY